MLGYSNRVDILVICGMDQRLEHVFSGITPEQYWDLFFFDEPYEEAIHAHLQLEVVQIDVTREGEGSALTVRRELHLRPQQSAPGFLAKLFAGSTLVKDRSRLDLAGGRMETRIELPTIGRRVEYGGCYRWQAQGDGFVRTWDGHCRARIPLLGARLERYLLGELKTSLDKAYAFTERWIADHPRPGGLAAKGRQARG